MLRLVWQLALFGYLPNFNSKIQKYAVILLLTETASNMAFWVSSNTEQHETDQEQASYVSR